MNPTPPAIRTTMGPVEWFLLILLGVIWGSGFFFAHLAVTEIPPLTLVLLRVGIAALALHLYLLVRGVSFAPALPRWQLFVALSLANNIIPFSLIFLGQTVLGAGVATEERVVIGPVRREARDQRCDVLPVEGTLELAHDAHGPCTLHAPRPPMRRLSG